MEKKILPSLPCKKCLKRKADADDDGDDGIIHLVVGEDSKVGDILPLKGSRQVHVVLRGETNFYFGPKNRACIIALNVINSMVLKNALANLGTDGGHYVTAFCWSSCAFPGIKGKVTIKKSEEKSKRKRCLKVLSG